MAIKRSWKNIIEYLKTVTFTNFYHLIVSGASKYNPCIDVPPYTFFDSVALMKHSLMFQLYFERKNRHLKIVKDPGHLWGDICSGRFEENLKMSWVLTKLTKFNLDLLNIGVNRIAKVWVLSAISSSALQN